MAITLDLSDHVVLVTGGVRGIGAGITRAFLDAGATVVTCARHEPEEPVRAGDNTAHFTAADVRDADRVQELVRGIVAEHGRLDIVVNNAGGSPYALTAEGSPRFHSKVVDLNLLAPLNVAQAANAVMQDQDGGGLILMISSVSAHRASPGTAAYGAAKAGLENLTRTLGVEWAPRVRVNGVTVGMVRTEQAHLQYGDEEGVRSVARTVPLGRLAEPADIGACCVFLASPMATYVNGATLLVDGGGERPAFLDAATANREAETPGEE